MSETTPQAAAQKQPTRSEQIRTLILQNIHPADIARTCGVSDRYVREVRQQLGIKRPGGRPGSGAPAPYIRLNTPSQPTGPTLEPLVTDTVEGDTRHLSSSSSHCTTVDEYLKEHKVDLSVWEVVKYKLSRGVVVMREPATTVGGAGNDALISEGKNGEKSTLWTRKSSVPLREPTNFIQVWLARKNPLITSGEALLELIRKNAPTFPNRVPRPKAKRRRALEIDIMDPHIGLLCSRPEADEDWDLDIAERSIMNAIDKLIDEASAHGPFEQVFMPFGNDFTHADNVFHTTTAGTGQPEAISWHRVYLVAKRIAVAMVERVRATGAEVFVYEVPGNHSRQADFTLAQYLEAYYRHDKDVHVDASSSPYKFHRYGVNLIGFEHGHSVKAIRLASLMANERPKDWAETHYREWHLGDQHRKSASNPVVFEEQGVSVEFLPAVVTPNEWHRLKGFNHQQRGAMAFVWDHDTGPAARIQHNIFNPR